MAAAVADFRPAAPAAQKIKKDTGLREISLENTTDILAEVAQARSSGGFPRVTVGFAAESQHLLENARAKMKAKKLDIIAANDIASKDAGFAVDTNRVTLLFSDGHIEELPLMSKDEVAAAVLEKAAAMLNVSK
jgi:phosphopantothenoylcysteine decarboxylase/phosphopantothenate--cysteine ligase